MATYLGGYWPLDYEHYCWPTNEYWDKPLPLIVCNDKNKLKIVRETASLIEQIEKSIVVVTIAGPYRTGKSYLMNRLAGKSTGFCLGSTIKAKTKGIWAWKVEHPYFPEDKVLLLLDTEGLGDADKGDPDYDTWILSLSLLLSSTFIYNILGVIGSSVIDQLSFALEISRHLTARSMMDWEVELDEFFPTFVLAIRDFYLELRDDDIKITADQYLEESLKSQNDPTTDKQKHQNKIRKQIRSYFKARKCFCFERPIHSRKGLLDLENKIEAQLVAEFRDQSELFCKYIYDNAPEKRVQNSQPINGRKLVQLMDLYLKAIENGVVPCIDSALSVIKKRENEKAVNESIQVYQKQFRLLINTFPVTTNRLEEVHTRCLKQAKAYFVKYVFLDEGQKEETRLQNCLKENYDEFKEENNRISFQTCNERLRNLFAPINKKAKEGIYIRIDGFKTYDEDIQEVKMDYFKTPNLGPSAESVWNEKMKESQLQKEIIMQTSQVLIDMKDEEIKKLEKQKEILVKEHKEEMKKNQEAREVETQRYENEIKHKMNEIESNQLAHQERLRKLSSKGRFVRVVNAVGIGAGLAATTVFPWGGWMAKAAISSIGTGAYALYELLHKDKED